MRRFPGPPFPFLVFSLLLAGCGANTSSTFSAPAGSLQLRGSVHGGTQPISGASIQLFAAGTNGYGTGAASLLTQPVTTDAQGSFSITGDYTCPAQNSQLYLTATGGNPGLSAGTTNAALKLMAALGPCSTYNGHYTLDPNLFIGINEVTTAAAAYALSGFFSADASQIGTSATNATGFSNAVSTAFSLADITKGTALAQTPSGGTAPQAKLNAVANMLSACVNSNGSGAPCTTLFSAATPTGGTAPTNTLQAAVNIAQHPTSNVASLYSLASSTPPFQPTITTAPNDWALSITFPLSTPTLPTPMAIDAGGHLWLGNTGGTYSPMYLLEVGNDGALLSGSPGYPLNQTGSFGGLAIDPSGNVWTAVQQPGTLVEFAPSGSILRTVAVPSPTSPVNLAIDTSANVWAVAFGNGAPDTIYKFDPTGNNLSGPTGFGTAGLLYPSALAADAQGNMWVNEGPPDFARMGPNGATLLTNSSRSGAGTFTQPAVDSAGNLWLDTISGSLTSELYEFTPTGAAVNGASGVDACNPVSGYVCFGSSLFALDGAGNAWVGTSYGILLHGQPTSIQYTLTELSPNSTFLTTGKGISGANNPGGAGLQIDNSGNLWEISSGTLTKIVGAATPVTTPYSLAAQQNKLASRP